jgi:GT2 family glycosyltransferase
MKNKKNGLAPICLFTYNRLAETELTVMALKNNYLAEYSDLIIFSDSAKSEEQVQSVLEIRRFIKEITGFKTVQIIESKVNKGLANSIISGVNQIFKEYEKVIVIR